MLQLLKKLKLYTKLGPDIYSIYIWPHKFPHQNLFAITCTLPAPRKVFLQLELDTWKINITGNFIYLEMPLIASNTHISRPLFRPLWKIVNDLKSYVPAVPMIMSFKVLKFISIDKISFFLFASLGYKISN